MTVLCAYDIEVQDVEIDTDGRKKFSIGFVNSADISLAQEESQSEELFIVPHANLINGIFELNGKILPPLEVGMRFTAKLVQHHNHRNVFYCLPLVFWNK
jgi:hypothetical protein